jgi:hypothetical protein
MKIRFKEDRKLVTGGTVEAGKVYSFEEKEAKAFIANGVAEKVKEKKEK